MSVYDLEHALRILHEGGDTYYNPKRIFRRDLNIILKPRVKIDSIQLQKYKVDDIILCEVGGVTRIAKCLQYSWLEKKTIFSTTIYAILAGNDKVIYGWTNRIYGLLNERYYSKIERNDERSRN